MNPSLLQHVGIEILPIEGTNSVNWHLTLRRMTPGERWWILDTQLPDRITIARGLILLN